MKFFSLVFFSFLTFSLLQTQISALSITGEAVGSVGLNIACNQDSACIQGSFCCNNVCREPSCGETNACSNYDGLDVQCINQDIPCDAQCVYQCSNTQGYHSCSLNQSCPDPPGLVSLGPTGNPILCCPEPCIECDINNFEPIPCSENVNGIECTGHSDCISPGQWSDCIFDDPNCGQTTPPIPGGGGSSGGGGGGGTTSQCKKGATKVCGPEEIKGLCKKGVSTCENGKWSECVGAIYPSDEKCNTFDDNCNDFIDDVYGAVTVEETACFCVGGQEPKIEETCNGIDDDCNSVIDDYADCCFSPGQTRICGSKEAGIGICISGTSICGQNELWEDCIGAVYPEKTDYCFNGLDDDCNGFVDDNCEHCKDGIKNMDEEGVDCNGSCLQFCINWFFILFLLGDALLASFIILLLVFRKKKSKEKKRKK